MILGFVFVQPYIHYSLKKDNFRQYMIEDWAGQLGFHRAFLWSVSFSYLLILCHIFYVIGLDHISVSLLNATYQFQAVSTILLSVWILGDNFGFNGWIGVTTSLMGISFIVLPPLFDRSESQDNDSYPNTTIAQLLFGIIATLISACLWGVFQVLWRVFSERRYPDLHKQQIHHKASIHQLIDTITSLAMFGFCNLTIGWTILPILHLLGIERFELPPSSHIGILTINAAVEYSFNASCAIAIHFTAPIITSVTAPLTIPLSWLSDWWIYGVFDSQSVVSTVVALIGAFLIVVGIVILELNPNWNRLRKKLLLPWTNVDDIDPTLNYSAEMMNEESNLVHIKHNHALT